MKKTLFLSSIGISRENSPGMFMESMLRYFPADSISCFALISEVYVPNKFADETSWLDKRIVQVPTEMCLPPRHPTDPFDLKGVVHWSTMLAEIEHLADEVVEYIRNTKSQILWVLCNGPFMIALALRICRRTGIPAHLVVYDPPEFMMDHLGFNKQVQEQVMGEYRELLAFTKSCAVASEEMKRDFENAYGIPAHVFYLPIERHIKRSTLNQSADTYTIGFGGYMQFRENFEAFINALNSIDWRLNGKNIRMIMYSVGQESGVLPTKPQNLEYRGYLKDENAVIDEFSKMDVGYLPFWLRPNTEQALALKYCFPTKLSLYVTAGCKVFFHGPKNSSPSNFMNKYELGVQCDSLNSEEIVCELSNLLTNTALEKITKTAREAALENIYNPLSHRSEFSRYIGCELDELKSVIRG